jgi:hypothetical protein
VSDTNDSKPINECSEQFCSERLVQDVIKSAVVMLGPRRTGIPRIDAGEFDSDDDDDEQSLMREAFDRINQCIQWRMMLLTEPGSNFVAIAFSSMVSAVPSRVSSDLVRGHCR